MHNRLLFRFILYMLIAVWALYFFKAFSREQAVSVSAGIITGAILGWLLIRLKHKS